MRKVGGRRKPGTALLRYLAILTTLWYTPGKEVFWHSSAHVLGEACERHYGCLLEHGPPTSDGFFYDMCLPENKWVSVFTSSVLDS